jgi:hypothetical protein
MSSLPAIQLDRIAKHRVHHTRSLEEKRLHDGIDRCFGISRRDFCPLLKLTPVMSMDTTGMS